ncbi:NUDIX domain-containing protein [Wielerella bovis]|uniref:NUDIX domain-containing protein n=1 Tax=Wielerella bovis TaxID=2917790 RepID=UPI00201A1D3B|nr:NUDIX domain-containing protein [Wielerella bovis]ULJ68490.1 NUDIX domain-containing protein [Wielerella bovis]
MPPIIHVVAGILYNESGEFLLSSRPAGKPYAGYWEFAGGKVEAGESEFAALQREFAEELGIDIQSATPWLAKFHQYEHAQVHLRFFRVQAHEWRGELQAREQQQWAWQRAGDLNVSPMLPANTALLNALAIPTQFSGSLKTGLVGHNTLGEYRVVPHHLAEITHQNVWLHYDEWRNLTRQPEKNSVWIIVDNVAQFQAALDADVFIWRVADDEMAHAVERILQDGAAQPIVVCAPATLCERWGKKWLAVGAQAVLCDDACALV